MGNFDHVIALHREYEAAGYSATDSIVQAMVESNAVSLSSGWYTGGDVDPTLSQRNDNIRLVPEMRSDAQFFAQALPYLSTYEMDGYVVHWYLQDAGRPGRDKDVSPRPDAPRAPLETLNSRVHRMLVADARFARGGGPKSLPHGNLSLVLSRTRIRQNRMHQVGDPLVKVLLGVDMDPIEVLDKATFTYSRRGKSHYGTIDFPEDNSSQEYFASVVNNLFDPLFNKV